MQTEDRQRLDIWDLITCESNESLYLGTLSDLRHDYLLHKKTDDFTEEGD